MNTVTVLKKTLRSGRTWCPVHPKSLRLQKTTFRFPPLTCSECLRKCQQSSAKHEVLLFITPFGIITSTGAPWGSTQTSKCSPMKCSCHWPGRYRFGSWQTIIEPQSGWSGKGALENILSNSPAKAGSPRTGCTGSPLGWVLNIHSLSGQSVPWPHHPHSKEVFPHTQMTLPVFKYLPVSPCPVAEHHWKDSGPMLLTTALKIFMSIDKIPSQLSLVQAKHNLIWQYCNCCCIFTCMIPEERFDIPSRQRWVLGVMCGGWSWQ